MERVRRLRRGGRAAVLLVVLAAASATPLRFPDFKLGFITVRDTVQPGFNRHRDFRVTSPANNRALALAVPGGLGAAVQKALWAVRVTGGHLRSQRVTIVGGFT